jgi:hypothetical protein
MFMIKGRKYNVEYEGLHLLSKICEKFGHHSEGCPEKPKTGAGQNVANENGGQINGGLELSGIRVEGPWMLVQKQKRNTKTEEKEAMVNTVAEGGGRKIPAKVNANGNINGSRFGALMEVNEEDGNGVANHEEIATEPIMVRQVAGEIENKKGKKVKMRA